MKRSLISIIIPIILGVFAIVGTITPVAYASSVDLMPACPFGPLQNRTIVQFGGTKIVSSGTESKAKTGDAPVSLLQGTYTVTLFSYDAYKSRTTVAQPNESWFVQFLNGGSVVALSNAISDLPDYIAFTSVQETVNSALVLPSAVSAVRAYHAFYPDTSNSNSVYPVCAAFDKHEEPEENQKPAITVLGNNPFEVTLGNSFTDPGATANDQEDGDITSDMVVGGNTIDTNTIGTYIITYNVKDSDDVAADEATRAVNVKNHTSGGHSPPPQCSDEADNDIDELADEEDSGCHTDGDPDNIDSYDPEDDDENSKPVITLTGNATTTITQGDSFTDPGATANDPEDGDITSDMVVGGSVNANTPGTYTITYNVTDSDSVAADEVTRAVVVNQQIDSGEGGEGGSPSTSSGYSSGGGESTITAIIREPCQEYLRAYIKLGQQNDPAEVRKLESFLNIFEGFSLPVDGIYDERDFDAIGIFQERYFNDILAPWGHTERTGYVYYTTRKKINEIVCNRPFPLNTAQLAEVETFKALLETLRTQGITPAEAGVDTGAIGLEDKPSSATALVDTQENSLLANILAEPVDNREPSSQVARLFDAVQNRSHLIGIGLIVLAIIIAGIGFMRARKDTPPDDTSYPPIN